MTVLPIRLGGFSNITLEQHLKSVRKVMVGFHEHQQYPLEALVAQVNSFESCDIHNTFRVYMLMQNYRQSTTSLGDLPFEEIKINHLLTQYIMRDFEFIVTPADPSITQLNATFSYRRSLFKKEQIIAWKKSFLGLLETVVNENGMLLKSIGNILADWSLD